MKKVLSVAAVALALSATAVQAHEGLYVGTSYQAANFKVEGNKEAAHTANLIAGYDFNEYLAVEGRLGMGVSKKSETTRENNQTVTREFKPGTSYAVFAKGKLPLNDMFGLYALAGYGKSPLEYTVKSGNTEHKEKLNKGSFQYAAGVEVNFTQNIAMTAEYGVYGVYGYGKQGTDNGDVKYNTTGFNLCVQYKF